MEAVLTATDTDLHVPALCDVEVTAALRRALLGRRLTERRARQLDAARVLFWRRHGRDVRAVEELWQEPTRVVRAAPPPHPHFPGFAWELDPDTNEITSTFYKTRYRLHIHDEDVRLRARWRADLEAESARGGGSGA